MLMCSTRNQTRVAGIGLQNLPLGNQASRESIRTLEIPRPDVQGWQDQTPMLMCSTCNRTRMPGIGLVKKLPISLLQSDVLQNCNEPFREGSVYHQLPAVTTHALIFTLSCFYHYVAWTPFKERNFCHWHLHSFFTPWLPLAPGRVSLTVTPVT